MKALRETFPSVDFDNPSSSGSSAAASGLIASETASTASSSHARVSATSKSVQSEEENAQHILRTNAYHNSESQVLSALLTRLFQNESSTSSGQSYLGDGGHADSVETVSTAVESDDCARTSSDKGMRRSLDSISDSSDADKRLFPIKQLIHGTDEEAFLKIRHARRRRTRRRSTASTAAPPAVSRGQLGAKLAVSIIDKLCVIMNYMLHNKANNKLHN